MKKVAIMCRVSSDEQAKGYSLDDQMERLKKYCSLNNYEIAYVIREDHSAKSFDRPEWKKWLLHAKRNFRQIDQLLIVTWDRFAREATDALMVIRDHREKWGITIQSTDQPIDFSIPEQKVLLHVYLTLPEIDNDRRSLKIKGGIRQALKSGRWTCKAPIGYLNKRDEINRPIIIPDPNIAPIVEYGFKEIAKGRSQSEVLSEMREKGIKLGKTTFSTMLRRHVYIGKIVVPQRDDEPETVVEGQHEGIVSEELFDKVQWVLSDKKRKLNKTTKMRIKRAELPLRGFLSCSSCGAQMTGSASKGRSKRYFYYHCNHCKIDRHRAELVNEDFERLLNLFTFDEKIEKLYQLILQDLVKSKNIGDHKEKSSLQTELQKYELRMEKLQDSFFDGIIEAEQYKQANDRYKIKIYELQDRLKQIQNFNQGIEKQIASGLNILKNLANTYKKASVKLKQKIISSIFPENLTFSQNHCRTAKINPAIALILSIDKGFRRNKKGQHPYWKELSCLVVPPELQILL